MSATDKTIPRRHLASVPRFALYDLDRRAMPAGTEQVEFEAFMRSSVELTGFTAAELAATGMARAYYEELGAVLGMPTRTRFLAGKLSPGDRMKDDFHGPLARNLIRLWYLGQWKQLDCGWIGLLSASEREKFDEFQRNTDRVISAGGYREGLAWTAIGTHPSGAKQPGFGSWAAAPPGPVKP